MDELILAFDRALRAVAGVAVSGRPIPGDELTCMLGDDERAESARLMRVNHSGEVCAQALYQGQAVFARDPEVRRALDHSANEEVEHLAWTGQRVAELGGATSRLDPLWYFGAFTIGAVASAAGDRWSLGFLRETERQVVEHLDGHLNRLPLADQKTRAIVDAMREDEARHADHAAALGAAELPVPVKLMMRAASRVMTTLSYRG